MYTFQQVKRTKTFVNIFQQVKRTKTFEQVKEQKVLFVLLVEKLFVRLLVETKTFVRFTC